MCVCYVHMKQLHQRRLARAFKLKITSVKTECVCRTCMRAFSNSYIWEQDKLIPLRCRVTASLSSDTCSAAFTARSTAAPRRGQQCAERRRHAPLRAVRRPRGLWPVLRRSQGLCSVLRRPMINLKALHALLRTRFLPFLPVTCFLSLS